MGNDLKQGKRESDAKFVNDVQGLVATITKPPFSVAVERFK
jgi:hypothetical protein